MSKHTPGPWTWDQGRSNYIHGPDGETIVDMSYDEYQGSPRAEANARLIAKAPELLEALRTLSEKRVNTIHNHFARADNWLGVFGVSELLAYIDGDSTESQSQRDQGGAAA